MECGNRFRTLETEITEEPKKPKPVKEKIPYVAKEVAEKIKQKKVHARRAVEDMLIAREEADIFDEEDVLDEDIQWTSNL
jgi:hypothetical protein